jgi:hypothetical protein
MERLASKSKGRFLPSFLYPVLRAFLFFFLPFFRHPFLHLILRPFLPSFLPSFLSPLSSFAPSFRVFGRSLDFWWIDFDEGGEGASRGGESTGDKRLFSPHSPSSGIERKKKEANE